MNKSGLIKKYVNVDGNRTVVVSPNKQQFEKDLNSVIEGEIISYLIFSNEYEKKHGVTSITILISEFFKNQ
jgi:hypothetical protein